MAKVLFIGGGRRVSLAERFIDAGHEVNSYELTSFVPIRSVADVYVGETWDKAQDELREIVAELGIELLVPLMDAAVPLCAGLGVRGCYAPPVPANICLDKAKLEQFMLARFRGAYPADNGEFPKIAKPRRGFGSNDIAILNNSNQEKLFPPEQFVIQAAIEGPEYSVDAYFDPKGTYVDSVPRLRLRVAGGEVIASMTVINDELQQLTKDIGQLIGLVGPCCFQFIRNQLIEINARFGGGTTLSMEAGLDIISLIGRDYLNIPFDYVPDQWKRGMLMERAFRDYFFVEGTE